jgi:N-acetyl-gamma-glutamyl-phosphate reductase
MHIMHRVSVLGAAGYSGLELLKLLAAHPAVTLVAAASDSNAGKPVSSLTGGASALTFATTEQALATPAEVVLMAVPHEPARALGEKARATGAKVVDLSNAHRTTDVYGLTSLFPAEIAAASLVANPGCYATCVITGVAPLVRHGLVERDVIVAAGSGVTGAGKQSVEAMSLGEMDGNVRAYKVLKHQHVPEIEMALGKLGTAPRVILTTHLLPIARGIFATITMKLTKPAGDLVALYRADYEGDPTVTVCDTPEDVSLRKVVGTNQTLVGVATKDDLVVVTAALDNLLKGAAGQAVENMNLVLGLPRTTGLTHLARHG